MNKSIIVYGPQGCGKTRYAERIAKHFGLSSFVDGFDPVRTGIILYGMLYLTNNMRTPEIRARNVSTGMVLPFAEVAKQINDAIPRTEWFPPDVKPAHIGAYEVEDDYARIIKTDFGFQSYNGKYWGVYCSHLGDPDLLDAEYESAFQKNYWRGLAEEPIIVRDGQSS